MTNAFEVNFDGLIGPSHNYGGLSDGNLASSRNAGDVSNPREAALQGLEKMRRMLRAGLKQGVLPPPPRPSPVLLRAAGYSADYHKAIPAAAKASPAILKASYSASAMWAANAATVSPSPDTEDHRLHLTVANLTTMLHRSVEHVETERLLRAIFGDASRFAVHQALPVHTRRFGDEGAANHTRLCAEHSAPGVEFFVYGAPVENGFPARQSRYASEWIANQHGLGKARTVYTEQGKAAIQAGAFHNDVVCVGTLDTLFFHEHAFDNTEKTLDALRRASEDLFELRPVMVPDADVPLSDAISSYLFNSQLLQMPGEDRLVLVAPTETEDTDTTRRYCEQLVSGNGPIGRVDYVDVRQSMRNGGGPACLRLRVVMTDAELAACHQGVLLDEGKIDTLQDVVRGTYRDRLAPSDIADPKFADECFAAREKLLRVLDLDRLA